MYLIKWPVSVYLYLYLYILYVYDANSLRLSVEKVSQETWREGLISVGWEQVSCVVSVGRFVSKICLCCNKLMKCLVFDRSDCWPLSEFKTELTSIQAEEKQTPQRMLNSWLIDCFCLMCHSLQHLPPFLMFSSVYPYLVFLVRLLCRSLFLCRCVCLCVAFYHLQLPIYLHTCDPSSNQRLQYLYPGSSVLYSPDCIVSSRGTMLWPTQFKFWDFPCVFLNSV